MPEDSMQETLEAKARSILESYRFLKERNITEPDDAAEMHQFLNSGQGNVMSVLGEGLYEDFEDYHAIDRAMTSFMVKEKAADMIRRITMIAVSYDISYSDLDTHNGLISGFTSDKLFTSSVDDILKLISEELSSSFDLLEEEKLSLQKLLKKAVPIVGLGLKEFNRLSTRSLSSDDVLSYELSLPWHQPYNNQPLIDWQI